MLDSGGFNFLNTSRSLSRHHAYPTIHYLDSIDIGIDPCVALLPLVVNSDIALALYKLNTNKKNKYLLVKYS